MVLLPSRQVHLDFHTSGDIKDIAIDFDAKIFAKTFKDAFVNSVNVFARCHHGYIYYDSKAFPKRVHPHLKRRDLLKEQVQALHAEGIRAPVYLTIQWDLYTAKNYPQWLIRKNDGTHEGGPFTEPGFYQSLCVNTGYRDFLKVHVNETIDYLENDFDGFWFDITGIRPCVCTVCSKLMKEQSLDLSDDLVVLNFAMETMNSFKADMSVLVRMKKADATIFYNAGHIGPSTKKSADAYTHFEMESLPGEPMWGYLHFPVSAHYASTLGKDCLGMTGKFHTSWGDFHSLKNQASLEFECFRMLSFGCAASIGDQLEPSGVLNPATYKLIGNVYKKFKEYENWGRPGTNLVEAALITSEPVNRELQIPESIMGAVQMLEELSLQFNIIDIDSDLSKYKLIILPDDLIINSEMQNKIDDYVAAGGAVIACARGGSATDGSYPKSFSAVFEGENEYFPDFIIAEGVLADDLEKGNEYVIYLQGLILKPVEAKTILTARAPYFPRVGDKFCSHRYTPSAKGEPYPAALQNGKVILFSHRLFEQYRTNAPLWCKKLIKGALDLLLPDRMVRHNGSSTMTVSLIEQPEHSRVNAHLLSYIPVHKSATIDIIEEPTLVRDIILELNLSGKQIKSVRLVPDDIKLELTGNKINVPEVNGYAIVEINL